MVLYQIINAIWLRFAQLYFFFWFKFVSSRWSMGIKNISKTSKKL